MTKSNAKRWVGVLGAVALSAGCASRGDVADIDATQTSDVNWSFAEVAAVEQQVADLQVENSSLRDEVAELKRELDRAKVITPRSADPAPAALPPAPTPVTPVRQAAAEPVIEPPTPDDNLPAAPVPVEAAPRLVQPTFTGSETTFENEAVAVAMTSVLWGVHLDSYSQEKFAREGWRRLQRAYPDQLGLLEPRTEKVFIEGRGDIYRLIGGGFASETTAKALCSELSNKNQYCRVVTFDGERLSLAEG